MGTGILAIALTKFPLQAPALFAVAEGLWWLNMGLFSLFTILYSARWIFFFNQARHIFGHSVVSMFFGCIPMGLATIINGFLIFGIPHWGHTAVEIAKTLWWIDAGMSLVCGVVIPFMMFTRQNHTMEQMTAVWLLPVVAAEVAAVSAGLLVPHLADVQAQAMMLALGYLLWAFSVPLAMSILVILVLRMALYKLPPANMAASSWLALGPIGTGSLGLMTLGEAASTVFKGGPMEQVGAVAHSFGLIGGAILWGYGLWWLLMAILITSSYVRKGFPFNIGWWGYTFPLGVYSVATLRLAGLPLRPPFPELHAFSFFGGTLVVVLALLWLVIGSLTLRGAWRGELFVSPCLKQWEEEQERERLKGKAETA